MKTALFLGLAIITVIALSGCIDAGTVGSPILGNWDTKVLGFTQTIRFESNGTGVLVTTLGQQAFQFQIADADTLLLQWEGNNAWDEKPYSFVNNNTLQFEGQTWVRQGSV